MVDRCVLRKFLMASLVILLLGTGTAVQAKQTFTFWSSGYSKEMQDWLQNTVFPKFEQKYDVTVEYAEIGWATAREQKLLTAYIGGVFPDVYVTGGENYAIALDDYIAKWPDARLIDRGLIETARDLKTGKIYGLPYMVGMIPYAYNKRILMESGLNPAPPQSWDELLTVVKRTTKVAGDSVAQSGFESSWASPYVANVWDHFVTQAGGMIHTPDARKSIIKNSDIALDALKMIKEVYSIVKPAGYKEQNEAGFVNGKVAISRGLSQRLLEMMNANPADVEYFDVYAPKRSKQQQGVTQAAVHILSVSNQTTKPEMAWEFVKLMVSKEMQTTLAPVATYLVIRRDVAADSKLEAVRRYLPWYNIMPTVTPQGFFPNRAPVASLVVSVMQGKTAPEPAIEQMHTAFQTTLDSYWKK